MKGEFPSALSDEVGVIGCCLLGGIETSLEAIEQVPPSAFLNDNMRELFAVIEELATENKPVDLFSVQKKWTDTRKRSLPDEYGMILDSVGSAANLPYHVDSVIEAWRKRKIMESALSLYNKGQERTVKADQLLAEAESSLYAEEVKSVTVLDGKQSAARMIDDLERRFKLAGALAGIPTGFRKLDQLTEGLQYTEQTIIAARPSMGKTALGLNIVEHACIKNKVPTLFVSLEMSTAAIMRRLLSSYLDLPMKAIRRGSYNEGEFAKFTTFQLKVRESPLWIIDGVCGLSLAQVAAAIRRKCRQHGIKLVVVDYLQKIKPDTKQEKRTYEIGEISGHLKGLAVSTGAAFLTLAQLNRESEKDKGRIPRLSDLADSGQIERDADTVALIHRDRTDPAGKTDLIVAKQRDGETGTVELLFNGEFCRFENATYEN